MTPTFTATITRDNIDNFIDQIEKHTPLKYDKKTKLLTMPNSPSSFGIRVEGNWKGLSLYYDGITYSSSTQPGVSPNTFYYVSGIKGSGVIGLGINGDENNFTGPQLTHGWDYGYVIADIKSQEGETTSDNTLFCCYFAEPVYNDGYHRVISERGVETLQLSTSIPKSETCTTLVPCYLPKSDMILTNTFLSYNFRQTNQPNYFTLQKDNNTEKVKYSNLGNVFANEKQQKFIIKV